MFKKVFLLSLALLASSNLIAADADSEGRCRQWAQEENISQDELAQYMEECLASLAISDEPSSQEASADAATGNGDR